MNRFQEELRWWSIARALAALWAICLLSGCTGEIASPPGQVAYGATTTGTSTTGVGGATAATTTLGLPTTITTTQGAVSTTGQIQCQPGQQLCGTACVDLLASPENCGACGAACPEGRLCAAGACSTECVQPYTQCGGVCVLLASDSANCGACGTACAIGTPCVGGVCGCPAGTLFCGGQCVDPLTTASHCGSCDVPCPVGGNCLAGTCQCPVGTTLCGNECVSLATAAHCGTCENVCATAQICDQGQCVADTQPCTAPTVRCGTGCVDTQTEPGHCGGCDLACTASEACVGGVCGCGAGLTQCTSGCVDTTQSPLHCGACDTPCTNGQVCQGGSCVCSDATATPCGNACVQLQTDTANCGACGTVCETGMPCTAGECKCPDGQVLCAGQCVNTESDPTHCGACGTACPQGESCVVGVCSGAVGDSCTSTLAYGISLTAIAVYQAGKVSVMEDGAAIGTDSRDVAVVAGKNAVFRAFVQLESGFTNRVLSARLSLIEGEQVEQVFHKRSVTGASSEDSLATTFNIEVDGALLTPTTRYALEIVECDASTGTQFSPRFPASGDTALEARDVGVLRIQFIPVVSNGIQASTDSGWLDGYRDYMEAMYPVSAVEYTVGSSMQANSSISANGSGWSEVLQQLSQLHQSDNAANDLYYYGLVQPASSLNQFCSSGCVAGVGYVPSENTRDAHARVAIGLSFGDEGSAETLAHEVGHNHGRPHAPCGGVADAEAWPYAGTNQNGAPIGWWGFRYPDQLIESSQASDIMGYCEGKWVSDYNYNNFMERLGALNGTFAFINPNPSGTFLVIVVSSFGMSWGVPPQGEVTAVGAAESARILDQAGNAIAEVTVYRSVMDHLGGASVMVPTPEPGWHAIELAGELPLVFASDNSSLP